MGLGWKKLLFWNQKLHFDGPSLMGLSIRNYQFLWWIHFSCVEQITSYRELRPSRDASKFRSAPRCSSKLRPLIRSLDPSVCGWKIGFCGKNFCYSQYFSGKNRRNDFLKLYTAKWKATLMPVTRLTFHCFSISLRWYCFTLTILGSSIFRGFQILSANTHWPSNFSMWYFIIISGDGQHRLAELFGQRLLDRNDFLLKVWESLRGQSFSIYKVFHRKLFWIRTSDLEFWQEKLEILCDFCDSLGNFLKQLVCSSEDPHVL